MFGRCPLIQAMIVLVEEKQALDKLLHLCELQLGGNAPNKRLIFAQSRQNKHHSVSNPCSCLGELL